MDDLEVGQSRVEADGTVTVRLSDRVTVKMEELNGMQQRNSDKLTGTDVGNLVANRALFTVRAVNGQAFGIPESNAQIDTIASMLKGREMDRLSKAYATHFMDPADAEQLKN